MCVLSAFAGRRTDESSVFVCIFCTSQGAHLPGFGRHSQWYHCERESYEWKILKRFSLHWRAKDSVKQDFVLLWSVFRFNAARQVFEWIKEYIQWTGKLWCVILWCVILWCVILWCVILWCVIPWCVIPWCVIPWCVILWCVILWCVILWCVILWCVILWCAVNLLQNKLKVQNYKTHRLTTTNGQSFTSTVNNKRRVSYADCQQRTLNLLCC